MLITGWGNNINYEANAFYPKNDGEIIGILKNEISNNTLAVGLGRSYGDNGLSKNIIKLNNYEKFFELDEENQILHCSSNYSLKEIIFKIVKKGFFLNVTPGSKYVTIGGAIANDVHGKNHHVDGSFSDFVKEIKIITPDAELRECSKNQNTDLFLATCGGAGLTGVIVSAKIKLLKISSKNLDVSIFKTKDLEETLKNIRKFKNKKYLIGWMETVSKKNFGRSIIITGDHSNDKDFEVTEKKNYKIPSIFGYLFLNKFFIKIFNFFYFNLNKDKINFKQDFDKFFYPLDYISNWNKLYGPKGFTQIQILISDGKDYKNILNEIFSYLRDNNCYSFLTTLKEFGEKNENYLTFPEKGLTVTMDIKITKKFEDFYKNFEKILQKNQIKIYLAKDSFMSDFFFKNSYKKINKFISLKKKIDPLNKISSVQSNRLGIL